MIPNNIDHNPHTLDLLLTNLPHSYSIKSLPPIGSSDHILLRAHQNPSSGLSMNSSKINVDTWLFNIGDWDGLRDLYSVFPRNHYCICPQPSDTVNEITEIIKLGMETYIPGLSFTKKSTHLNGFPNPVQ